MDFFGNVDRDPQGRIKSEYPAWFFKAHIDQLQESIDSGKRRLARGEVPLDGVMYAKARIEQEEVKLREITSSAPTLGQGEEDKLKKFYNELSLRIQESLFTRSEMMLGLADPHEEARRMSEPCIKLSKELKELASISNVKVTGELVTRNGATKMFQLVGRILGEPINVEFLRKDKATSRTGAYRKAS